MDYKEYSRQRDIAVKRVKRMSEAGYKLDVKIPTVKELRSMSPERAEAMRSALEIYLDRGASLQRKRESERIHYSQEEQAERRREYQRDYRRRRVAQEYAGGRNSKYESYLKGIKTLGVDLKPSQLPGFFQYMDYRFSQGNASKKYVFDIFVDDYKDLLSKGYKPDQIVGDYEKFISNQLAVAERAGSMQGYSLAQVEGAIDSWDAFKSNR